jgi:enterochelin esterase-like enzyme
MPSFRSGRTIAVRQFLLSALAAVVMLNVSAAGGAAVENGETLQSVVIRAEVPPGTGTLYLTGNRPGIGNWNPAGLAMAGSNTVRTVDLRLPRGTALEFKFTLGSWDREALGPSGTVMPNYRLDVDADKEFTAVIPGFKTPQSQKLDDPQASGVIGRLIYWTNVSSVFLAAHRNVEIWLPPGYDTSTNRYDVLYMHDGQNLFDPRLSFTGVDWGVDEALERCVKAGKVPPTIVVGIWNTDQRLREYSPWDLGTNYARFLIEELMPRVNREFRTRTGPAHTVVMGSSMGGLISFWLGWRYPQVFGGAGALSPALWWTGDLSEEGRRKPSLLEGEIAAGATVPRGVRFYFDYGTGGADASCGPVLVKIAGWLEGQGLKPGSDFVVRAFPGAQHNEASWRVRLDEPLQFLFSRVTSP